MKTLYLLRHAQTEWNKKGISQGKLDTSINEEGKEEAERAKKYFENNHITFEKIYTSRLQRTIQTAAVVVGNKQFIERENLDEQDLGNLEGKGVKSVQEIQEADNKSQSTDGETAEQFKNRVLKAFQTILEETEEHTTILGVMHAGVLKRILSNLLKISYEQVVEQYPVMHNCGITKIEVEENVPRLIFIDKKP